MLRMESAKSLNRSIIIEGVTQDGRKFRPSDWAERMSGMLATFGRDHRMHYSPLLRPVSIDGVKCVVIDATLRDTNAALFAQLMAFAKINNLKVVEKN
ncbi:MAG: DUF3579 domain-containing protein [Pseudomonadota bacterium]